MQKIFFLAFSILFFSIQAQQLSNNAEISVLTVGPGTSLNDAFGHSAFRVLDKQNNLDLVYGFGQYDFDTPNFYLKFAQGRLKYLVSKTKFNRFYHVYSYLNRSIKEQVLNLSLEEKQHFYNNLLDNYKPENRAYFYEFFFDNCATKIKDVANSSIKNGIKFNTPKEYKTETFRTLIHNNLNRNSWGCFGIDIALGAVIDKEATPEEHMFLPENIFKFFKNASLNESGKPLVKENKTLYKKKPSKNDSNFLLSPLFILGIVAVLILFITYRDFKKQKQTKFLDISIFIITGIIGMVILLLWFATDHKGTHQNYNLLWANILNLLLVFQFFKKRVNEWFVRYLKLIIILLCLLCFHWILGVQVFAIGLIPLLIALFVRYIFLVKFYSKN